MPDRRTSRRTRAPVPTQPARAGKGAPSRHIVSARGRVPGAWVLRRSGSTGSTNDDHEQGPEAGRPLTHGEDRRVVHRGAPAGDQDRPMPRCRRARPSPTSPRQPSGMPPAAAGTTGSASSTSAGTDGFSHRETARWLNSTHGAEGWWAQSIWSGMSVLAACASRIRRREGFEVSVSKTFPLPVQPSGGDRRYLAAAKAGWGGHPRGSHREAAPPCTLRRPCRWLAHPGVGRSEGQGQIHPDDHPRTVDGCRGRRAMADVMA